MTSISINKSGQDQVVLELMQTGSYETSVNLKNYLLDSGLTYMFSVASLSVPLNNAPISSVTADTELFRVLRRDVDAAFDSNLATGFDSRFMVSPNDKHYDVSGFARSLANWARGFNVQQSLLGLADLRPYGGPSGGSVAEAIVPPLEALPALTEAQIDGDVGAYNFHTIQVTPDGKLQVTGTNNFWNNFIIMMSSYGAAKLGLSETVVNGVLAYTNVGGVRSTDWYGGANLITAGNHTQEIRVVGDHPLWQSADERVKCTVDSHLPMAANLAIVDQKETVSREIAEAFFETKLQTSIKFDDEGLFTDMTVASRLYSGQVSFIKKSDLHTEWHKLLTAYELRYFRFHLYIWYRKWSGEKWELKRQPLDVPKNKYWSMAIRFVSES